MKHQKLFLIDGIGAFFSAFILGVVFVNVERLVGMPRGILYSLSSIALLFAFYSLWNYSRKNNNWRPFMRGIAYANLLYSLLTIALIFSFRHTLTILGGIYFLFEILIVIGLVATELRTANNTIVH